MDYVGDTEGVHCKAVDTPDSCHLDRPGTGLGSVVQIEESAGSHLVKVGHFDRALGLDIRLDIHEEVDTWRSSVGSGSTLHHF